MEYCDATIDPSLRHENLSLYHDSGTNLVLRSAGEITAAQDYFDSPQYQAKGSVPDTMVEEPRLEIHKDVWKFSV
jgi:hypothetical protein